MKRELFGDEHELFRKSVRTFIDREVRPHQERWAKQGMVDREAWKAAGDAGMLCTSLDPAYGGSGGDFLHATIVIEELVGIDGIGSLAVTAVRSNDITMIQGLVLFFVVVTVAINLAIDLMYSYLNPKVRLT